MAQAKPNFVGIDLGTTYTSLCRISHSTKVDAIPNREGNMLTPSAVYFSEELGVIVGREAIRRGFKNPKRFVAQVKRDMGSTLPCAVIDGVEYFPVDIAALILRKVLADAETKIGPIKEAIITVPAHFNPLQRQQTIAAGKQAGLEKVGIVSEPVAAALSFVLGGDYEQLYLLEQDFERTLLIYDLGGGTFDLSLVRFDQRQLRVLAATGDLELGGIDWDQVLVDMFAKTLRTVIGGMDVNLPENEDDLRRLMLSVVACKEELSGNSVEQVHFKFGDNLEYDLTRQEFEEASAHLVERTKVLTKELMESAGVRWKDIDRLVPVGGATRMPMIKELIQSFSQYGPDILFIQPDLSVAKGAALFAAIIAKEGQRMVGDAQLLQMFQNYQAHNVTSHSLGILVRDDNNQLTCHVLIPKNSPLPATQSTKVQTRRENQKHIAIKIVESEIWNSNGRADEILCRCKIQNLPENLPIGSVFQVDVIYDPDGLLQVIAKHEETGRSANVSIVYS